MALYFDAPAQKPSTFDKFSRAFSAGTQALGNEMIGQREQQQEQQQQSSFLKQIYPDINWEGATPEMRQKGFELAFSQAQKRKEQEAEQEFLNNLNLNQDQDNRRIQFNETDQSDQLQGQEESEDRGLPVDQRKIDILESRGYKDIAKNLKDKNQKYLDEKESYETLVQAGYDDKEARRLSKTMSPTTARTIYSKNKEKPVFEEESSKLAAKASAEQRDQIVKDYEAARLSDQRLDRQIKLAEKGNLSTPLMVKTLETLGLPVSVLANPDSEEFEKIQTDHVKDVSSIFPGAIRVYEIQTYLKTIPTLLNSDEGKMIVARNSQNLNKAKKLKYDALQEILKENDGNTPKNLDIKINNRVAPELDKLAEEYKNGISENVEKFLPTLEMFDAEGNPYDIPYNQVQNAQKSGLNFK